MRRTFARSVRVKQSRAAMSEVGEEPAKPFDAVQERLVDAEIERVRVPILVRVAAALVAVEGVVTALFGVQLLLMGYTAGWITAAPIAFMVLGAGGVAAGAYLGVGRFTASWASVLLSAFVFLLSSVWFVSMLLSASFSCLGMFVPLFALAAAVLAPFTIKPCHQISLARRRLRAAGLALGF
jgi:hypothetical protein